MPERGRLGHFWSHFLDLRESGGSNQKMLVCNLEEPIEIGEVCFWVLSIALIVSEKIGFLWKICENFSFGCRSGEKNDVAQKILTPQSCDGQMICSVDYSEQNGISATSIFPQERQPKLKCSQIFHKNPIFPETIDRIDKALKNTSPIFLALPHCWESFFY